VKGTGAELAVADGVRLEYRRWPGRGRPVLLLHEALGSFSTWRDFPGRLAAATGREVVAWSRAGHGSSDPAPAGFRPDYLHREADLLPAVMAALGIGSAHLFGHSDGASIALIAAARHPGKVAGLILEAPHVHVEERAIEGVAAMARGYGATGLRQKLARHHADGDRVFRRWSETWLDPHFRDWSIEPLLFAIRAPVLLIQGLEDEYGTLDQLDRIAAALPGCRRLELPHCGHSPHREQPEAVLAAARAFLAEAER